MVRIKFCKQTESGEDALGNKVKSETDLGLAEGSISVVKQSTLAGSSQQGASGYEVSNVLFSITVIFNNVIMEEATLAEVDGVKYQIMEKYKIRTANKLVLYCKKVK